MILEWIKMLGDLGMEGMCYFAREIGVNFGDQRVDSAALNSVPPKIHVYLELQNGVLFGNTLVPLIRRFAFRGFTYLWKNFRNEQFISLKLHAVLSRVTKSCAIPLHPTQDINPLSM